MEELFDKLEYLSDTKGLIKEAIKSKGVSVQDEDTFRSYVTKIENIPGTDTSDSNATANDLLSGKTAYVQGQKITGNIPTKTQVITPTTSRQDIESGYHTGSYVESVSSSVDANIVPENIKDGVTILSVEGTLKVGTDTSDATATASDILEDKTAYVDGQKLTGTLGTESKTVKSTTSSQTITPTSGKLIDEITVDPIRLFSGAIINPRTSAQTVRTPAGYDGIESFDIAAVTSSIDSDIKSSNIKSRS